MNFLSGIRQSVRIVDVYTNPAAKASHWYVAIAAGSGCVRCTLGAWHDGRRTLASRTRAGLTATGRTPDLSQDVK